MQSEILCRNRKLCPHCIIQTKNIWKVTTYKGTVEFRIQNQRARIRVDKENNKGPNDKAEEVELKD